MTDPQPIYEAAEPPPRLPFWGYGDLFLFIGLSLPCMLLGAFTVRAFLAIFGLEVHSKILILLPAQFLGYGFLFLFLLGLFKIQYGRPFWRSLGWAPAARSVSATALWGVLLAFAVGIASALMKTPDIESPMKELLSDPRAVVLVALFGTTLGPLFEELAFRGFMQPLFVRSLGVVPGILLAALPFGLLHLQQYAFSWRHGLLITLAGAGFGWMRHRSGSTKFATIMHAAYNCTFFVALLAQRKDLPHIW